MRNIIQILIVIILTQYNVNAQTCHEYTGEMKVSHQLADTVEGHILDPVGVQLQHVPYDRLIYWTHGLSGDASSWAVPGSTVQAGKWESGTETWKARKVRSFFPEYDQHSLTAAKVFFHNEIEAIANSYDNDGNITADRNRHFVIAHSQGGIVSRATAQMIQRNPSSYNEEFGGIVTFGSPHQGAQILNNINPNGPDMLNTFINSGCNVLSAAAVSEGNGGILKSLIWRFVDFGSITEEACGIVSDFVLPLFLDDFFQGVSNGYQVGPFGEAFPITELDHLNVDADTYEAGIAKVAFFGEEARGQGLWRLFDIEQQNRDVLTNHEAFSYGDNDDESLIPQVQNIIDRYYTRASMFSSLGTLGGFHVYYHIEQGDEVAFGWWLSKKKARNIANKYMKGAKWLETADSQFEVISGERVYQRDPDGYKCICVEYVPFPFLPGVYHRITKSVDTEDEDFCYDNNSIPLICGPPIAKYNVTQTNNPGDVIVLSKSAKNFPGAVQKVKMPFTNHQKLRNSQRTGNELNKLFNGDYDLYFETEVRNP